MNKYRKRIFASILAVVLFISFVEWPVIASEEPPQIEAASEQLQFVSASADENAIVIDVKQSKTLFN